MSVSSRFELRAADDAVTSVIGALLVAAILVSFLAVVQVEFVPVWEGDVETQHLVGAEQDLARLGATLVSADTDNLRTTAIALTPAERIEFGPPRLPAELSLQGVPAGIVLEAPSLTLYPESDVGSPVEAALPQVIEWTPVNLTATEVGLERIDELRFRISGMSPTDALATFKVTFTDGNGVAVATLDGSVEAAADVTQVRLASRDARGELMGARNDAVYPDLNGATYFLDLLDSQLRIAETLSATLKPIQIDIAYDDGYDGPPGQLKKDLIGFAQLAYTITHSTGARVAQGAGVEISPLNRAFNTSVIRYDHPTQFAVDQDFVLEHGALLVLQPDGAVVKASPGFSIAREGAALALKIDAASLAAMSEEGHGRGTATIALDPRETSVLRGDGDALTLRFKTAYPEAWATHWHWRMHMAGFGAPDGSVPGLATEVTADAVIVQLSSSATASGASFEKILIHLSNPIYGVDIQ